MNNLAFANALKRLADIRYMEADVLNEWAAALDTGQAVTSPAGRAATPAAVPAGAPSFDELPQEEPEQWDEFAPAPLPKAAAPTGNQGSLGQCPKHKVEYADGRYGPYCKQQSDEGPDWANAKGYCRITPKNAGAWLRQHAGAAA